MNTPMKSILMLLMTFLLVSCVQQAIRDRSSPFYQVPVGSRLILNQPVEIKVGHTRRFVQSGAVMDFSDLDQYRPSCSFEVRDLRQELQQILPDSFTVVKVQQGQTEIVGQPHLQVAGLGLLSFSHWGGGQPMVARYYDLWLASDQQPNVMRLRCFGSMADLSEAQLPLFMEIEAALGAIATIEI